MTDGNNLAQSIPDNIQELQETTVEAGDTVVGGDVELKAEKREETILDKHARNYSTLIHPFSNYVDRMSLKSLRRVLKALIKYPFEMAEFRPQGTGADRELEKMAFGTGHAVLTSKYMMVTITQVLADFEKTSKELDEKQTNEGEKSNG